MAEKDRTSFTIDEDTLEEMRSRDDVNWSGIVNDFLNEFIGSGQSTEAALAVRKQQIEDELADVNAERKRLERELERIEATLEDKRDSRREVFEAFSSLSLEEESQDPSNAAVENHAKKLGMTPQEFLMKYKKWKGE